MRKLRRFQRKDWDIYLFYEIVDYDREYDDIDDDCLGFEWWKD